MTTHQPTNPSIDHLTYQVLSPRHLRVWRIDRGDGISWDELQAVKDEAIGAHAMCIELYPPTEDVVNEAQMRHLWVVERNELPDDIGLASLRNPTW